MCGDHDENRVDTKNFQHCQEYCNGNIAIYYCPQCWTNYCEECYDKEHKLKRRKEDHDKIQTPREVCSKHKLTLEYQNKAKNSFLCCMCVKEMSPGEFAANPVESIDSIASVMKCKLEEKIAQLETMSNTIRSNIGECTLNISTSIEDARNEVRRFFSALNLLLTKQEESFQYQLTNLSEAAQSKPLLREMNELLSVTEGLTTQGKTLLAGDSLIVARDFDGVSTNMDTMLGNKTIANFVPPKLRVSVNVHRHLLEMVRHPGYISSSFDDSAKAHETCEASPTTNLQMVDSFHCQFTSDVCNEQNNNGAEPFLDEVPSIPICSPPSSLPEEDDKTQYSLLSACSCSSSPLFTQADENSTLRPLAVNTVVDRNLSEMDQDVCSCPEEGVDSLGAETEAGLTSPDKEGNNSDSPIKSQRHSKRKLSESSFFFPYNRKTRRNETSKELNRCDDILTELWAYDDSFPFARPVDAKKVPRYYEVIKSPMDLAKIKSKLESISYDSIYDFVDDMKLMFDNCYQFNPPRSATFNSGVKLERLFIELLHERFPSIYYESSQKKMTGSSDD